MKNANKVDSKMNQQGETTSNRMHEKNDAKNQTKIRGNSNSGGQSANETSNKHTGGDKGNKK